MAKEFLGNLDVDLHLTKHRAKAMTERVPTDSLLHPHLGEDRTDMTLENHVRLKRLRTILLDGRKDIVRVSPVIRLRPPLLQFIQNEWMEGYRFAGPNRLGIANDIAVDGTSDVGNARLEIEILPAKFEDLTPANSGGRVEEDHGAFTLREVLQERLQFLRREKFRIAQPLG